MVNECYYWHLRTLPLMRWLQSPEDWAVQDASTHSGPPRLADEHTRRLPLFLTRCPCANKIKTDYHIFFSGHAPPYDIRNRSMHIVLLIRHVIQFAGDERNESKRWLLRQGIGQMKTSRCHPCKARIRTWVNEWWVAWGWLGLEFGLVRVALCLCVRVRVRVCFYGCAQRLQWRNNKEGKATAETINWVAPRTCRTMSECNCASQRKRKIKRFAIAL